MIATATVDSAEGIFGLHQRLVYNPAILTLLSTEGLLANSIGQDPFIFAVNSDTLGVIQVAVEVDLYVDALEVDIEHEIAEFVFEVNPGVIGAVDVDVHFADSPNRWFVQHGCARGCNRCRAGHTGNGLSHPTLCAVTQTTTVPLISRTQSRCLARSLGAQLHPSVRTRPIATPTEWSTLPTPYRCSVVCSVVARKLPHRRRTPTAGLRTYWVAISMRVAHSHAIVVGQGIAYGDFRGAGSLSAPRRVARRCFHSAPACDRSASGSAACHSS